MSESAGRTVAWINDKGWVYTSDCGPVDPSHTALVPEQLLVEAESKLAAVRALADRLGPAGDPKDRFDEGYDAACQMFCAQIRALTETPSEETR